MEMAGAYGAWEMDYMGVSSGVAVTGRALEVN